MANTNTAELKTYDEWLAYFRTVIPQINPNWTNTSDDDLGMVLVKLIAMVADETNFRVDMSTLEAFLGTVRERSNAQSILNLIGYTLNTYATSKVQVDITYADEQTYSTDLYLPAFTSFSTESGKPTYYTLENYTIIPYSTGVSVEAYEGSYNVETRYSTEVDSNGRLYLNIPTTYNVAENAVVITYNNSIKLTNVSDIYLSTNNYEYQLLVDHSGYKYIQFDVNWNTYLDLNNAKLLSVEYLVTSLSDGSVGPNSLTTIKLPDDMVIDRDLIINNTEASTSYKEPEAIETARIKAPKYARTMGTAVTIGDYEDIINVNRDDVFDVNVIDMNTNPELNPYDLEIYILPSVYDIEEVGSSKYITLTDTMKSEISAMLDEVKLATINYSLLQPEISEVGIDLTVGIKGGVYTDAVVVNSIKLLVMGYLSSLKIGESFYSSQLVSYIHNNTNLANILYILTNTTVNILSCTESQVIRESVTYDSETSTWIDNINIAVVQV